MEIILNDTHSRDDGTSQPITTFTIQTTPMTNIFLHSASGHQHHTTRKIQPG
jgi:hypothetical protein